MTAKKHHSFLTILLILVVCASLLNVRAVLADGETPTEPPATQVATEPPTDSATEAPVESTPQPVEATATPLAEALTQTPEGTAVVVTDENGDAVPLATQDAAEITDIIDPMWCPEGVLPGGAGCTGSFSTISALLSNMRSNPSSYDENGVIYFTANPGTQSLSLTDAGTSLGSSYNTLRNYNMTLQGGWDGASSINGQTNFGTRPLTIGTSSNPWVGNLTLNDFVFGSASSTSVTIYTTTGNITLNNVDVNNQGNGANTALLNSTSGNISVTDGTFDGNRSGNAGNSAGFSATTGGSINVNNSSFTDNIKPNAATSNGATLTAPIVTLANVIARNNDGSGVFFSGSSLFISGGTFSNNQRYGVEVANPAGTTLSVLSNATCTGNSLGCYNDDDSVPVITPLISGTAGANGWYTSNVSVTWSVSDPESGISSSTGCTASNLTAETAGTTLTCSATNGMGLVTSVPVTVKIDKTDPVLTLPANITAEAMGPAGAAVSYSALATDNLTASPALSCSQASGATFRLGTTTVSCSATDDADNAVSGSFQISVQDTTPPSIAAITDMTAEASSASGRRIYYTDPATADLVDGAGVASCSPASGSLFSLGDTQVFCSATDAHGNTAIRMFMVSLDRPNQSSTSGNSNASNNIAFTIPLTGGALIQLDCNSSFWAFGVKLSFVNLCNYQTSLDSLEAGSLPGTLPEGFSFVIGLDLNILNKNQAVDHLPAGSSIQIEFPISGARDSFAVLHWNGSEWTEAAPQSNPAQGFYQITTTDHTGIFVLVKK